MMGCVSGGVTSGGGVISACWIGSVTGSGMSSASISSGACGRSGAACIAMGESSETRSSGAANISGAMSIT